MGSEDQSHTMAQPAVLARTPEWLAVSKPAGWLTIPGRLGNAGHTGHGGPAPVVSRWAEALEGKIWVVHRLDRETSGVLLLARTAEAHRKASLWFQKHEVRKHYELLAQGRLRAPVVRVNRPIAGVASVTQVECRESFSGAFLGRAMPLTGKRHQIRIHLAGEGHPLLGDPTYGGTQSIHSLPIGRVALHASRLELPSREVFEAEWPEDFKGWVARLRDGEFDGKQ